MMLRNVNTGGVEVYDINNNQIIGANFMGVVGLDWQVGGFGNFSSRGTSDMILRNMKTGGLEVYDINSNQITGAAFMRSEEHTSELQSQFHLVCRLLLEKK